MVRPRYATVHSQVSADDLTLLGDCYYLPFEYGAEAQTLFRLIEILLTKPPASWENAYDDFLALKRANTNTLRRPNSTQGSLPLLRLEPPRLGIEGRAGPDPAVRFLQTRPRQRIAIHLGNSLSTDL